MLTDAQCASLEEAWGPARAAGVLGTAPIEVLVEHTVGFAQAVCSAFSAEFSSFEGRIIDVGTGAGLPGVVLAALLPRVDVTLVDASERRLDHVRRAARALEVQDRTTVIHARGDELSRDAVHRGAYDVAVARLLADPAESLEQLVPFVRPGGQVVLATATDALERWRSLPCPLLPTTEAALLETAAGWFASVGVTAEVPSGVPRREKTRRRSPAF